MTVEAAAAALDVHPNTIRNWIRSGHMRASKTPGGFRRPYVSEVVRLAESDPDVARGFAGDLDAVAERLERRAAALRAAADALRGE